MSILKEYLSLIPTAFKNREHIAEGIINKVKGKFGGLSEDEQKEILRRQFICEMCPYNSKNAKEDGYQTDRLDDHCIFCTCNIDLKTSCLNCDCGITTWNEQNPNEKLPLRWTAYKKPTDDK